MRQSFSLFTLLKKSPLGESRLIFKINIFGNFYDGKPIIYYIFHDTLWECGWKIKRLFNF